MEEKELSESNRRAKKYYGNRTETNSAETALIKRYAQDDFFEATTDTGYGAIQIFVRDKIIGGIIVEKDFTKLHGYLLTSDPITLRRFQRLCRSGHYQNLLFNGERIEVDSDSESPKSSFELTPHVGNFRPTTLPISPERSAILDRVEAEAEARAEAEAQTESEAQAKVDSEAEANVTMDIEAEDDAEYLPSKEATTALPKGTINIMICMHASDSEKDLPELKNKFYSMPPGLSNLFIDTQLELLQRIYQLKEGGHQHFQAIYHDYQYPPRLQKLKSFIPIALKTHMETAAHEPSYFPNMALLEKQFKELPYDIQYVKYKKDRHFDYDRDATDFLSGIFITGSNIDERLKNEFPVDFSHLTDAFYQKMTDVLNAGFDRKYTKQQATEHFQALQRINILNVEVLKSISGIFGVDFLLDRALKTSRDGTGILHYVDFHLSDLFDYFTKVGIKMVFGIDEGCRISHASAASRRAVEEAGDVTPRKARFPGGTRSFRKKSKRKGTHKQTFKQKRLRRFHKKS